MGTKVVNLFISYEIIIFCFFVSFCFILRCCVKCLFSYENLHTSVVTKVVNLVISPEIINFRFFNVLSIFVPTGRENVSCSNITRREKTCSDIYDLKAAAKNQAAIKFFKTKPIPIS